MERQYIGARYVPKFFENPNTSDSAWLAGVAYETLTIVTLAGNSYTSKKPVPAGIGAPNLNPEYWVNTGNYNAQVEEITQRINDVESDLTEEISRVETDLSGEISNILPISPDKMAEKHYIFITDSYGNYYNSENKNFIRVAMDGLREPLNNYLYKAQGSAGFAREGAYNFLNVFKALETEMSISNVSPYTDIFVFGGANDQVSGSVDTIKANIKAFCDYVIPKYYNAKVYIGTVTRTNASELSANFDNVVRAYSECADYGAIYLPGSEQIMCYSKLFRDDHVHPTETAVNHIASYVAELIKNHSCTVQFSPIIADNWQYSDQEYPGTVFSDSSVLAFNNGIANLASTAGGAGLAIDVNIPSLSATTNITGLTLKQAFNPPRNSAYANGSPIFVNITHSEGITLIPALLSFIKSPNTENGYPALLILYPNGRTFTNVTRISLLYNIIML